MTIVPTVYTKPSCVQCTATKRAFEKAGIRYITVDLSTHPEEVTRLQAEGHQSAPVVVAGNETWDGFRPDRIAALTTTRREGIGR